MASTDSLPIPRKNVAYRVVFPILDADGDLVTGASGLDSEVSKDQGTFADCTNEATEIATSSGMYYLDLTSTEMNADCVAVIVKTSTVGAKTTPMAFYPLEDGDWRVNVVQWLSTAASTPTVAGVPNVNVKTWNDLATVALPLVPTTPGRTLVVDAAGLADANMVKAGPTGSGTAQTAGDIIADTNDIQARLPAALDVNGFMKADVEDWKAATAPAMTGDAFARLGAAGAGLTALGDARIANLDATISSRTKPADTQAAVTNVIGVGTAAISNTSFAAGAFDAAALATDAANEIRDAIFALAMVDPAAVPAITASFKDAFAFQFALSRNLLTQTATTQTLKKDDGTTTIGTSTVSDDGTTFSRGKWA